MQYISYYESPLGRILLAGDGRSLTGLWFEGQKYFGDTLTKDREEMEPDFFRKTKEWLDKYFSGKEPDFTPELSMEGSDFRKLQKLPGSAASTVCQHRQWAALSVTIQFLSLSPATGW